MKRSIQIVVLGLCFFCYNCKHKTAAEGFRDYVDDPSNHICFREKVNDADILIRYIPARQQKSSEADMNYPGNIYFDMKVSKPGLKKDKSRSLYLDFDIQNDFQLAVNNELLIPAICQKIENGMKDSYEYLIAFDTPSLEFSKAQKADLIYTDKIFSVGQRKYTFKKQDILKIPKLTDQ